MRISSLRHPLAVALALALPLGLAACQRPATDAAQATGNDPATRATAGDRQNETARLNAWFDKQYEQQL